MKVFNLRVMDLLKENDLLVEKEVEIVALAGYLNSIWQEISFDPEWSGWERFTDGAHTVCLGRLSDILTKDNLSTKWNKANLYVFKITANKKEYAESHSVFAIGRFI